jgi:hypothetical protein
MKFIIEVPETIIRIIGSSQGNRRQELDTTEELIRLALVLNEYHENVFVDSTAVTVTRVDDAPASGTDEPNPSPRQAS